MYALLAVIVWSVLAPAAWRWEHPTPQGAPLAALAGDGRAMAAVGRHGSALVSSDGGATWAVASTGVTADLHGVAMRGTLVIAVGEHGTILRSLDGGASYGVRPAPVAGIFSAVAIGPGGAIHVATREGGTLVSRDGGDSFVAQAGLAAPGVGLGWGTAIVSPAADVVLLGGTSGMFRSVDGGKSYAAVGGIAEPIGGFASDGGVLYAAGGASVVYATVDICGSCTDAGYAIQASAGGVLRSDDGGTTFGAPMPMPGERLGRDLAALARPRAHLAAGRAAERGHGLRPGR